MVGACVVRLVETVFSMKYLSFVTVQARTFKLWYGLNVSRQSLLYELFSKVLLYDLEAVADKG